MFEVRFNQIRNVCWWKDIIYFDTCFVMIPSSCRLWSGQGPLQLRLLPGRRSAQAACAVDGARGPAAGEIHGGIGHLVIWGAALGDLDSREPTLPWTHQPGGPPVCDWWGEAGQT